MKIRDVQYARDLAYGFLMSRQTDAFKVWRKTEAATWTIVHDVFSHEF